MNTQLRDEEAMGYIQVILCQVDHFPSFHVELFSVVYPFGNSFVVPFGNVMIASVRRTEMTSRIGER